jgi:cell division protein FtsL
MKPEPMTRNEKVLYVCLAIVLIYLAIKTGWDLTHHYQQSL